MGKRFHLTAAAAAAAMMVLPSTTQAFSVAPAFTIRNRAHMTETSLCMLQHVSRSIASYQQRDDHNDSAMSASNVSVDALSSSATEEEESTDTGDEQVAPPPVTLNNMEKAWRHVKKPLLSIGAKGATPSHGNSLRQLLEAHGAVKIKVNTKQFNNSLQVAFETLSRLAVEAGAAQPELLCERTSENVILVGRRGMRAMIDANEFPPPPPPPYVYEAYEKRDKAVAAKTSAAL
ncbi:hypothetical protein MPSEU_000335800 [Mayamaea pseudoterrestris]|nr:hypothetical protein MPSEU_000335800 [Mayamaea pseudoterrestris]